MTLTIACPTCGAKLHAPNKAAGRILKCPKCGTLNEVTAITTQPAKPPIETVEPIRMSPPAPPLGNVVQADMSHAELTKACPFCGETVLAIAKKCKHCHETIDVTLRVAEEVRRAVEQRDSPAVFMNAGGGGGGSSSAASAAAAAASGSGRERVKVTLPLNWPLIGACCAGGLVLGITAVVLLIYGQMCVGLTVLLFALSTPVGAVQRSYYCSFCEQPCSTHIFDSTSKCRKCGLVHVIIWE